MNRQPRTLLTLLLVGAIVGTGYLLWRDLQAPPPGEPRLTDRPLAPPPAAAA